MEKQITRLNHVLIADLPVQLKKKEVLEFLTVNVDSNYAKQGRIHETRVGFREGDCSCQRTAYEENEAKA